MRSYEAQIRRYVRFCFIQQSQNECYTVPVSYVLPNDFTIQLEKFYFFVLFGTNHSIKWDL